MLLRRFSVSMVTVALAVGCLPGAVLDESGTAPVDAFHIEDPRTGHVLELSWTNPDSADFSSVRIIRKAGACPSSSSDEGASAVFEDAAQAFVDEGLTNGTRYCYLAFALYDHGARTSSPVTAEGIPTDDTPPDAATNLVGSVAQVGTEEAVELTWDLPDDDTITGLRLLSKVGAAPINDDDGVVLSLERSVAFADIGRSDGDHVFYRLFTIDDAGNRSTPAAADVVYFDDLAPGDNGAHFVAQPNADGTVAVAWSGPDEAAPQGYAGARLLRRVTTPPVGLDDDAATLLLDGEDARLGSTPGIIDDSAPLGAELHYLVANVDAAGNRSATSAASAATPRAVAPSPSTLATVADEVALASLFLSVGDDIVAVAAVDNSLSITRARRDGGIVWTLRADADVAVLHSATVLLDGTIAVAATLATVTPLVVDGFTVTDGGGSHHVVLLLSASGNVQEAIEVLGPLDQPGFHPVDVAGAGGNLLLQCPADPDPIALVRRSDGATTVTAPVVPGGAILVAVEPAFVTEVWSLSVGHAIGMHSVGGVDGSAAIFVVPPGGFGVDIGSVTGEIDHPVFASIDDAGAVMRVSSVDPVVFPGLDPTSGAITAAIARAQGSTVVIVPLHDDLGDTPHALFPRVADGLVASLVNPCGSSGCAAIVRIPDTGATAVVDAVEAGFVAGPLAAQEGSASVSSMALDDDGNVLIAGTLSGDTRFGPPATSVQTTRLSGKRAFVARLDIDGRVGWVAETASNLDASVDEAPHVVAVSSGFLLVARFAADTALGSTQPETGWILSVNDPLR